jgi:biotin carboxyl carrier protein
MKVTLTIEGKQYQVELTDLNTRPIIAEVNGQKYEVWPEEEQSSVQSSPAPVPAAAPVLPTPAAPASGSSSSVLSVNAPLPGVIISIGVREGENISVGQELYVLEAMKMKNSIRSDREGKIATIHVAPGDLVKHSQAILTFEG